MLDDVFPIIRDCLSNKDAGWDALFKEYASIAMNILNKRFSSLALDDKEDVIQNAFSKLVKGGLKNFQGTTKYEFLAYFNKIVANEAHTHLEYGKKWKNAISLDQGKDCGDDQLPPIEIPDSKPTPDIELQRNELVQIIHTVLNDSPVEIKQIFLMKVDGHKDKEISDILGISMGTVASRYSRIRERIRLVLDKHDSEEKQ